MTDDYDLRARITELEADVREQCKTMQSLGGGGQLTSLALAEFEREVTRNTLAITEAELSTVRSQRDHATIKATEWNDYANELLLRAEHAETELSAARAEIATLKGINDDTQERLHIARAEIERVTYENQRLHRERDHAKGEVAEFDRVRAENEALRAKLAVAREALTIAVRHSDPHSAPYEDAQIVRRAILEARAAFTQAEGKPQAIASVNEVQVLREALEEIARPIKFMQERAKKDGCILNGGMAVMLSDDSNYLKKIASAALAKSAAAALEGTET